MKGVSDNQLNDYHAGFMKMKKTVLCLLAAALAAVMITGCGSQTEDSSAQTSDAEKFVESMGDTYSSVENIAAKYGSMTCDISAEYPDGSTASYQVKTDGKGSVVTQDNGEVDIFYDDSWYVMEDNGQSVEFSKFEEFDTTTGSDYLNDFLKVPCYNFEEDRNPVLTQNGDGYTWIATAEQSDEDGDYFVGYTVRINADYSISEGISEYTLDDGTVQKETHSYSYDQTELEEIQALQEALDSAGDSVRHLTYNIVRDGDIIKSFDTEVPAGFFSSAVFSDEYVSSEDGYDVYLDKELTQPAGTTTDLYSDMTFYVDGNLS